MCHRVQTPHCMQVTQNYTVKYKISRQLPVLTRRLDHAGKMEYEIEDKIQHRKVQGVDGYRMFGKNLGLLVSSDLKWGPHTGCIKTEQI